MSVQEDLVERMYSSVILGEDLGQVFEPLAASYQDVLFGVQVQCYTNNDYYYLSFLNTEDSFAEDMEVGGASNPFPAIAERVPFQSVIYSERYIPPAEIMRSEFYEQVLSKHNTFDRSRGFLLHRQGGDAAIVAWTMPDDFVGKEDQFLCDTLEQIRPHFQNAFSLALQLKQRENAKTSDAYWLERIPSAALVLDHGLHVSAANAEAENLFKSRRSILVDCRGELSTRHYNQRKLLEDAATRVRLGQKTIGPLALKGDLVPSTFVVMTPIQSLERTPAYLNCFSPTDDAILVIVIDPYSLPAASHEVLQGCMGVSKREAELVQNLVVGLSVRETAEKMQISYNTARNHLARVTEKVSLGSQSELIRFASDLAARMPRSF
ncbi:regulatory protein, luxR family [Pseudovibrio sp. Tun.PSC04-5.I4]|nr:regulatory protein, luxR family [Pseudovibrio sp. Tun.PSC04-5.I4]